MTLHNGAGNLTDQGELVTPTTREAAVRVVREAVALRERLDPTGTFRNAFLTDIGF